MRPIRIKFNSDRQGKFRIQTCICQDNGKKMIIKKALTEDAEGHLNEMLLNQEDLKKIYPQYHISKAKKIASDEVSFEFLNGVELAQRYENAIKNGNKQKFQEIMLNQKDMILACKEDNFCSFYTTEDFEKIFGDGKAFVGNLAMKISDFEFTSHNIIIDENTDEIGLIDYEYVFSFPVPVELILFHCLIKTNLWTICQFDALFTEDEMLQFLGLYENKEVLETAWNKFNVFFGQSKLAVAKQKYLKICENVTEIQVKNRQMEQEILGNKNYISILTDNLGKQQYYIQTQEKVLENQKNIIESQKNSILEKQKNLDDMKKKLLNLQEILENEKKKNIDLQNSVSWKATAFIRTGMDWLKKK